MLKFIANRILIAIPLLALVSIVTFVIIQLPPGDFLSAYATRMAEQGDSIDQQGLEVLREQYGLNEPVLVQYLKWMRGIVTRGDFGLSMEYNRPVRQLIWERIALTVAVNLLTILLIWAIAIPVGVFSATHKYSLPDYILNLLAFLGTGLPGFVLALLLMWAAFFYFGADVGGLFSQQYISAPWSLAKVIDLLKHVWVAVIVLSIGGAAGLVRTMRANMLDELPKPYVDTARAKGLREKAVIRKYPLRVALNPFISGIGHVFPSLISGSQTAAIVLNIPLTGPLLLQALLTQDMYLAGSFIFILSAFAIFGTLVSDVLLAWVDPRIRYEGR